MASESVANAIWRKYNVLANEVSMMTVRDRRAIFQLMKSSDCIDVFFPHHGFTFPEFAVWYLITEKKSVAQKSSPRRAKGENGRERVRRQHS